MEAFLTLLGVVIGAVITLVIFRIDRKDKFRFAAIERRLEAHQEAFKFWYELLSVIHKPGENKVKQDVLNEAYDFWENNALFLEKRTRKNFREAINIVSFYHGDLIYEREATEPEDKRKAKQRYIENWYYFMDLIDIIQQEVELEPLKPEIKVSPEGEQKPQNRNLKSKR